MNKNILYFFLIFMSIIAVVFLWQQNSELTGMNKPENLTFSRFKTMLTEEGKEGFGSIYTRDVPDQSFFEENPFILTIAPQEIRGRYLPAGRVVEESADVEKIKSITVPFTVESTPGAVTEQLQDKLENEGVIYRFENPDDGFLSSAIVQTLFILLIIGLLWFFMMRQLQSTGNRAMAFGKSKAKLHPEGKKKVLFTDVAGCDEAKQELTEVVDFLKDPRKFQAIGAKIPRGVLLIGPPGTGKTLLARAVAGEAGVPFFSISGSDFVEMFVGVGASRVRDLFEQAKKNAPCIIFVDEIDAVGRLRGAGLGGGHDEREQTLNQMLVEMDGFEENEGIIIMAATNRPDVLDPALLRPGRFDRQVMVDAPDVKGREEILKIHSRKIPLTSDVHLSAIARGTPGFTGADLANLVNEAALLAARRNKKRVTQDEMEEAKDKVIMGPERKSFFINAKEKEVIAYHEAGHALLGAMLEHAEPVHKVTIVPRGRALGLTQQLPEDDKHIHPSRYWLDRICVAMGGYIAEEKVFGDTSTGASNDIQVTTNIARRMVTEWGMSQRIGTISYSDNEQAVFLGREISNSKHYSDDTASAIDEEVKRIVQEQLDRGRDLIEQKRQELSNLAKALLEKESVSGDEVYRILGKESPIKKPEVHAASDGSGSQGGTESREDESSAGGSLEGPAPAPAT